MNKRPNILYIMTDQHRADWLGCAGHKVVRTPHIDGLAARGTRFTRVPRDHARSACPIVAQFLPVATRR